MLHGYLSSLSPLQLEEAGPCGKKKALLKERKKTNEGGLENEGVSPRTIIVI